ncbi:MAG: imidazole glycerol phosphate synthase subunit HisH [Proteobacteria bacterium]|nr:MAG: imidazole glycerol phosphate synthase subunit HisH [Pseudomonadota bacterium]
MTIYNSPKKTALIVDYGAGNLSSVVRALEEIGVASLISGEPKEIDNADRIILPGVGAFSEAMTKLKSLGVAAAIKKAVAEKKPLLGICLGMQLLAAYGEEFEKCEGLGIIDGTVRLFRPTSPAERIPHIGWNSIHFQQDCPIFRELPQDSDFYFVHSYHFDVQNPLNIAATTPFCGEFVSAVSRDNVYGVQFHPEKSSKLGIKILQNFIENV